MASRSWEAACGYPPKTLEFSSRPPRKSSRPPESLQKTRYATSRNPRNGAAILAVPRLNLLARPLAATKGEGFGRRALSAVSFRRSAFDVISVSSPRFAEKLQIKNLCSDAGSHAKIRTVQGTGIREIERLQCRQSRLWKLLASMRV